MVKRAASPKPGDDEPKYFTVVQPYPPGADWRRSDSDDVISCGRWIAKCIGEPAPFCAIWHKPSARGQILLEIKHDYPEPERLLGEHRWSEFLKAPSEEEKSCVSQVFYCTYRSGREAQKDGWKRIHVEDSWFNEDSVDSVIVHPYPPAVWCPLPPEDQTNKPMCRPLPVRIKPPPAPARVSAPTAVPGSASWVQKKAAPPTNTPAIMRRAWPMQAAAASTFNRNSDANSSKKKAPPASSTAPWHTAIAPTSSNTVALRVPITVPVENLHKRPDASAAVPPSITRSASAFVMETNFEDTSEYVAEWEKMPEDTTQDAWAVLHRGSGNHSETKVENLWDVQGRVGTTNTQSTNNVVCPLHGSTCQRGICRRRGAGLSKVDSPRRGRGRNDNASSNGWEQTKERTARHHEGRGGGSASGGKFNERCSGGSTKNDDGWKTVRH
ncbi:hypothetical protein MSAN_01734700 [Mycena sanguinolenta]|uniref:Uncharacterized protein n=1 Tax=Mycena sanguinolenta TaxID=230812 RepID=A0A8H6Y050_9AGAR|nr:hypothetical protein MSAN_01734700 [Mycena sanguinolenta]